MKNLLYLLFALSLFTSCSKEVVEPAPVFTVKPSLPSTQPVKIEAVPDSFAWCGQKIAAWGDSYTVAPAALSYVGYLAELLGTDKHVYDGVSQFKSQVHGWTLQHKDSLVFNGGVDGDPSDRIMNRFLADTLHRSWNTIFWMGANNNWYKHEIVQHYKKCIAALGHNRYVIIGLFSANLPTGWKDVGNGAYENNRELTETLKKEFPGHVYDPLPGLQELSTGSPADVLAIKRGVPPESVFLGDMIHLQAHAEQKIAQDIYNKFLRSCN